ncbi:hypothetical protein AB0C38_38095 [Amycolatopsis sp. NPDC048633]|uniref:hypothetical protein n=1 Tax=Amycolatopsis sp. NPDC048633 TaxID=3157095 RepID=UPI0033C8E4A6
MPVSHKDFPINRRTLTTPAGRVELTSAGTGPARVNLVPGTGFTAAAAAAHLDEVVALVSELAWPRETVGGRR